MYDDRHNLTGRRLRLPSTRTAFYLSPLLLAVALMLAAIFAVPSPADAQDGAASASETTIWSSTLTVDEDGVYLGCNNNVATQDNCSVALTDDDFVHNGVTYQVKGLYYASDTNRTFLSTEPASRSRLVGLELHLGTTQVTLGASIPGLHRWENVNPQWSDGQQVAVKLVDPTPTPTPVYQSTFTPVAVFGDAVGCWQHHNSPGNGVVNENAKGLCEKVHPGNNFFEWKGQKYYFYSLTLSSEGLYWVVSSDSSPLGGDGEWPAELQGTITVNGVKIPLTFSAATSSHPGHAGITAADYKAAGGKSWDTKTPVTIVINQPPPPTPTPTPTPTPAPTPTPTPFPSFKVFPVQFESNRYLINENAGNGIIIRWRCHPKLSDEECASADVQIYIASSEEDWAAGDAKHGTLQRAAYEYDYEFRSNWQGAPPREWASAKVNVRSDNLDTSSVAGVEPTERFYVVAQYKPDCYTADCKKYAAVDIIDSASTFMNFYNRDLAVMEEDRSVRLRVMCTTAICDERDHSFTIETSNKVRKEAAKAPLVGDTPHATVGTDYEKTTFTKTFPKGAEHVDITLAIMDDDKSEPDELMFVKLTVNGVENQEPRYAFVTIKDGDTAAVIGFNPTQYTRTEGINPHVDLTVERKGGPVSMPVQFTVTASDESTAQYQEHLAENGTTPVHSLASQDADYKSGKYKGRLGPGEQSTTVRIPLIDDNIAEAIDKFVPRLSVDSPGSEVDDSTQWALISIGDNDNVSMQASPAYCQLVEQGKKKSDQCKVALTMSLPIYDSINFSVVSSDTSAVTVNKSELTFTKDNWNKPQKVTIKAIDDHDYESEFVKVTVKATHTSGIQYETILEVPVLVLDNDLKFLKPAEYTLVPSITAHGTNIAFRVLLGEAPTEHLDFTLWFTLDGVAEDGWTSGAISPGQKEIISVRAAAPTPESVSEYDLLEYNVIIAGKEKAGSGITGYTPVGSFKVYQVVLPPTGGL